MDKELMKRKVEGRKSYHEFILGFHKKVINVIGQKKSRSREEMELLTYAVESSGKVMGLIDRDNQELRELEL